MTGTRELTRPGAAALDWPRYFPELTDATAVAAQWVEVLQEALELPDVPAVEEFLDALSAPLPATEPDLPFADWLTAHVEGPLEHFTRAIARLWILAPDNTVESSRQAAVADLAGNLGIRAMVTELAGARARGECSGATPEARYAAFRHSLPGRAPELIAAYPLLFRLIWHRVDAHLRFVAELLTATQRNWARITRSIPGLAVTDRIRHLRTDLGDGHAGGRTVAILTLDTGTQLVVKPRSLAVDRAYARVLGTVGEGVGVRLPVPATWTDGTYGWTEFITPPSGPVDLPRYLERLGIVVGVLHLLNANDMHFENLLVHPDGSPVVIDVESVLRPRPAVPVDGSPMGHALRHIEDSVLGMGVLPTILTTTGAQFDVGAVGYEPGQLSPTRSYELVNPGRDDMTIAFTRGVVSADTRTISLSASGLPAVEVRELLVRGFTRVTDWALAHRSTLTAVVASSFAGCRVRYIHQPTVFYGQLLRMMTHPDFFAAPQRRHMLAQRVRTRRREFPASLHRSEARQLFRGDIPLFGADASGQHLLDEQGEPVLDLLESPLATATARIRDLTPERVAEQVRLLRLSFVPKLSREDEATTMRWAASATSPASTRCGDARSRQLQTVTDLADELVRTMIEGDPGSAPPPTWVAPLVTTDESGIWSPGALGYDLYAGVPGLGLFLAAAGAVTGSERFARAGRVVLGRHARVLDPQTFDHTDVSVGVGQGVAGALVAALHGGLLLDDGALIDTAWQALPGLSTAVAHDRVLDYVTGTAGALAAALSFHAAADSEAHRVAAEECARVAAGHLCRWWEGLDPRTEVFTGFAHGLVGMAPYLIEFARTCADETAARAGVEMLARVDALRSPVDDDWALGSHLPEDRAYAWCHGAPGIALGLALSAANGVDVAPTGLARAVELTRRRGFGNNITACHGDLGSLEILRQVAGLVGDERLVTQAIDAFDPLYDGVLVPHLRRTDTRLAFTTSAFLGSSAIGLAICRHLDPRVPSLLSLR